DRGRRAALPGTGEPPRARGEREPGQRMSRPDRRGPRPALTRRQVLALGAALPFLRGCGAPAPAPATVRAFFPLDAYERAFFERHVLPPFERQANVRVQLAGGTGAEALGQLWADQRAGVTSFDLLAVDLEALGALIELVWACGGDPLALDDAGSRAAGAYLARLAPALAPVSTEAKFDSMTTALGSDRVALGADWAVVAADLLQRGGKRGIGVYAG